MIPLSKRENIYYLERSKIFVRDGVVQVASKKAEATSIPDKNTMMLLLGCGTSITNAAINILAESNTVVCFTNGAGSPLIMSSECYFGEMKYSQAWFKIFSDDEKRLKAAKIFCTTRASLVQESEYINKTFGRVDDCIVDAFLDGIDRSTTILELMGAEGNWAKHLYAHISQNKDWRREPGKGEDLPNQRLDHGNYIAYGFAAVALKALNIPYSLPVMHGRTNRGALIFDVADIVKDSIVLPTAFEYVDRYRDKITSRFKEGRTNHIEHMINTLKMVIDTLA